MRKRFVTIISLATGLLLFFFLFENVFVWNIGWKTLPVNDPVRSEIITSDTTYTNAIVLAKEALKRIRKASKAPAVSMAVGIDNKVVWAEAIGFKDIDKSEIADINTSFRIGSTSKAVTSLAIGKLMQTGLLDLDTPIQKYVSYFDESKPLITLKQLASHQSGIRNYETCFCFPVWEYYNNDQYDSVEEALNLFQSDDLLFAPGSQFSYSSYNYTVLSAAIEEISGKAFLHYMEKEIFIPLDMSDTSADHADKPVKNRATFYDVDLEEGNYKKSFRVNNSNKWAGGGFISTPSDLVKLGNALLNSTFLDQKVVKVLFTPQKLNNGVVNEQNYAIGWRSSTTRKMFDGKKEIAIIHHGGLAVGSSSLLILFPYYNMSVSLLMNKTIPQGQFGLFGYVYPIAEMFIREIESSKISDLP